MSDDPASFFSPSCILITGITGSFGTAMLRHLLATTSATIRGISRGELLQAQLRASLSSSDQARVRLFLGDVRDYDRLVLALRGVDTVYHAAALKRIDAGELDPVEFVQTNIVGTKNIIRACIAHRITRAVFLSSDKSVAPCNLYGATKLVAEKLWIRANGYDPSPQGTHFVALRYGNVTGSRGSVFTVWDAAAAAGKPLPITDGAMTRFWITLPEAVALAEWTCLWADRGMIMVPDLPAYRLCDAAEAHSPGAPHRFIGVRPGEKLHEWLLDQHEHLGVLAYTGYDGRVYYGVKPLEPTWRTPPSLCPPRCVYDLQTSYCSATWPSRLGVDELRTRLLERDLHVDH